MKPDVIAPRFRSRPEADGLRCLLVGRDVDTRQITRYLNDYFRRKGLFEAILRMKLEF